MSSIRIEVGQTYPDILNNAEYDEVMLTCNVLPETSPELLQIADNKLNIFTKTESPFYNYVTQNIPKCNKFKLLSENPTYPEAHLLANVKSAFVIYCYAISPDVSAEYLQNLISTLPNLIITNVQYNPSYANLDFTNIYCENPKVNEIPLSTRFLKIDAKKDNYLPKLAKRVLSGDFPNLERLTLCRLPTPEELVLLPTMGIKTYWLTTWGYSRDISYIMEANLFEKVWCRYCPFTKESLENNYVMTRCHFSSGTEHVQKILERNKEIIALSRRFHHTKSANNRYVHIYH